MPDPSAAPLLLLVHGWGLGPGVWHGVRRALPGWRCHTLDLGFFGPPRLQVPEGSPVLAVGHSLGFLWLLHHLERAPWREACVGLVSIAGFSRFVRGDPFPNGVAPRILARMQQRLPDAVTEVLQAFCRQGGWPALSLPEGVDAAALGEGLTWLREWDERAVLAAWDKPVWALAARDDQIVPAALTDDCFRSVEWLAEGGHLLPLTQPERCANLLRGALS